MNMKQFDFYEFAGVIGPRRYHLARCSSDLAGILRQYPESSIYHWVGSDSLCWLPNVVGHLLQGIGEICLKQYGGRSTVVGRPTGPGPKKGDLLSEIQLTQLQERIRTVLGFSDFTLGPELPARSWHPVFSTDLCGGPIRKSR